MGQRHTGDDYTPMGVDLNNDIPVDDGAEPDDAGIEHLEPDKELS